MILGHHAMSDAWAAPLGKKPRMLRFEFEQIKQRDNYTRWFKDDTFDAPLLQLLH